MRLALVTVSPPLYYAFMHGDQLFIVLLAIFFFFALLVAPILAVSAWVRVRRLEQQRTQAPAQDAALLSRLYALEQKLDALERRLADLAARPVAPAPVAAPPREAPRSASPRRGPATTAPGWTWKRSSPGAG